MISFFLTPLILELGKIMLKIFFSAQNRGWCSFHSLCRRKKYNNLKIIICGLLPRDKSWSVNSIIIKEINLSLNYKYLSNNFPFETVQLPEIRE